MLKAYKYRIYPTADQIVLIEKTFGCCRLVYNLALQTKIDAFKANGTRLSAFDLCYQLVDLKKEYVWLKEVDSQALQATIRKVDIAFKGFFKGGGYPLFKNKNSRQSFRSIAPSVKKVDFDKGLLTILKLKNIPIRISRRFVVDMKTITISKSATGKYFASILVDNKAPLPKNRPVLSNTAIGVDMGIKTLAVLSNGEFIENPKYLKDSLQRLKCLQRRFSRKKKGGSNRNKAANRVAVIHEKITNQRVDFLHKFSDAITKQYDTICVEDLNVAGMVKNHSLAQSISDVGWSIGFRFIKYKSEWRGKNYIEIGRFDASSKIHNKCGYKNETLTLADREWYCPVCNEMLHRDLNAAENIKELGLKKHSGEGIPGEPVELLSIDRAKKQEVTIPKLGI